MIPSRRFDPIGVARILVLCSLLFMPSASVGQGSGFNTSGASNCTVADFDANVQFANQPDNYYAIIVDKRNVSSHACVFDAQMYGPTFYPDRDHYGQLVAFLRLNGIVPPFTQKYGVKFR